LLDLATFVVAHQIRAHDRPLGRRSLQHGGTVYVDLDEDDEVRFSFDPKPPEDEDLEDEVEQTLEEDVDPDVMLDSSNGE
jgi:hypothetical protein